MSLIGRIPEDVAKNAWNWLMRQEYIIKAVSKSKLVNRSLNSPFDWIPLDALSWDSQKVSRYHNLLQLSRTNFEKIALKILNSEIGVTAIPQIPWDQTSKEILTRTLDDVIPLPLPILLNRFESDSTQFKPMSQTIPALSSQEGVVYDSWEKAFYDASASALKMIFPNVFSSEQILEEIDWPITSFDSTTNQWFKSNTVVSNPSGTDIEFFGEFQRQYNSAPSIDHSSRIIQTMKPAFTNNNDRSIWEKRVRNAFPQGLLEDDLNEAKSILNNFKNENGGSIFSKMWRRSALLNRVFPESHDHQVTTSEKLHMWDRRSIDRWINDRDKYLKTFARWLMNLLGVSLYFRNEIFPNADLLDEWPDSSLSSSRRAIFLIWNEGSWSWLILKKLSPFPSREINDTWEKCTRLLFPNQNDPKAKSSFKDFVGAWLKNFSLVSLPRERDLPTAASRLFLSFSDSRPPPGTPQTYPWIELLDYLYMDQTESLLLKIPSEPRLPNNDSIKRWQIDAKYFLIDFIILASIDVYLLRRGSFGSTSPIYLPNEPLDLALSNNLWLIKIPQIKDKLYQFLSDSRHYFLSLFLYNLYPQSDKKIDPIPIEFSIKGLLPFATSPDKPISRLSFLDEQSIK